MYRKEGDGGMVDELGAVISLEAFDVKAELCASVINKLNYVLVDVRLVSEGECPAVVGVVIQNHQTI